MRRAISISALLSGLMATPLLAGVPVKGVACTEVVAGGGAMSEETVHADRMQELHRRMMREMQAHMARVLDLEEMAGMPVRLDFVQYVVPMSPGQGQLMFAPGAAQTEKAAYMGVATAPVSGVVRDQLKLHHGMGLVVQYVEKGSPAAEAGLQQNDVLEKLDDQVIVNGPQLAVLVRAKKPGEAVTLGVIRGGERLSVKVTLAEKDVPVMEDEGGIRFEQPMVGGGTMAVPIEGGEEWQHGVRKTLVNNADGSVTRRLMDGKYDILLTTTKEGSSTVGIKDHTGAELYNGPYTTEEEKAKVPAEAAGLVKELAATEGTGEGKMTSTGEVTRVDSEHRITLKLNGEGKRLIVTELKGGKVIYDGPADSEEDLKKLPEGVAEKVKALEEKVQLTK